MDRNDPAIQKQNRYWRIALVLGLPVIFAGSFLVLFLGIPLMPCLFNTCTGLYCIGCGATRALQHLVHLHLYQALSANLFIFFWLPLLTWEMLRIWLQALLARPVLPGLRPGRKIALLMLISAVLFIILRNLPWQPFNWLAP